MKNGGKAINLRPNDDHKRNPLKTQKGKSWENFQGKVSKNRLLPPSQIEFGLTKKFGYKSEFLNWCQNKTKKVFEMSDRRRSDRPLPPAPHPGENGNGDGSRIGVEAEADENNHGGNQDILMAPPEKE